MNIAAALALQSVPFAGLAFAKSKHKDVFVVLYMSALGLLLSVIAMYDDYYDFSSVIGISVEAMQ
jgi:hypothetical protein